MVLCAIKWYCILLINIPCFVLYAITLYCYHSEHTHFTYPHVPTSPDVFFYYLLMHAIWGCIWKYTVEQILIIEANVTLILFMQAIWKFAYKCSAVQKRQTKSMNVYIAIDFTLHDLFQVEFFLLFQRNHWEYASSQAIYLRKRLKIHIQTNVISLTHQVNYLANNHHMYHY